MNYLAHLHLSGADEGLIVGNFIGDAIKGNDYEDFPEPIRRGILLHRFIDDFTDRHPIVEESKVLLRPMLRKYAGVASDMFYDHFLASNWSAFSNEPLEDYTNRMYSLLQSNPEHIPPRTAHMLHYMSRDNWLLSYVSLEHLQSALTGISRRTRFESGLQHAVKVLTQEYEDFEDHFHAFYPDLQVAVQEQLADGRFDK